MVMRLDRVAHRYQEGGGVLAPITQEFHAGTCTVLWGPSGAGKTTLLRLMGLACPPTQGTVWWADQDTSAWSHTQRAQWRAQHLGWLPQAPQWLAHRTVRENVLWSWRCVRQPAVQECDQALADWGLLSLAEQDPHTLSGGEQQRLAWVRATLRPPSLVLADEPTSALDGVHQAHACRVVQALCDQGTTVVLASHQMFWRAHADALIDVGR